MLCSVCNKNVAIIFTNKPSGDNLNKLIGYCYNCAKKQGINPLDILSKQAASIGATGDEPINLDEMSSQFEEILNDLSENLVNNNLTDSDGVQGNGIPLGNIFTNFFGQNNNNNNEVNQEKESSNS